MKINYPKIQEQAIREKIAYQYLIKKIINYRESQGREMGCWFCEWHRMIGYENKQMQCDVIGVEANQYWAMIDKLHTCNCYGAMKSKIDCENDHNYINFIPQEVIEE